MRGLSAPDGSWNTICRCRRRRTSFARRGAGDRLALEAHFAPARALQADEGSPEGALAAAALPDEAERGAAADRKIDAVDGAQKPFPRKPVMQGETDRFDDRLAHEALQQAA